MTEQVEGGGLTVIQRAETALAFVETKARLQELVKSSERITEITNKDGREECHAAAMVLKTTRTAIQKTGKEAREDAQAFAKAVIEKEKELVAVTQPEEDRLLGLRDAWDSARQREKEEAARIEAERVARIRKQIEAIKLAPLNVIGQPAETIAQLIESVEAMDLTELQGADQIDADAARTATLAKLGAMRDAAHAAEESARVEAERQAREAAEAAAKAEAERIKRAQWEADERAEREASEAAARAERAAEAERLAAQRRELEAQQAEVKRQQDELRRQQEEIAAAARAEREAAERAEQERQQAARREQEAKAQAEAEEAARRAQEEAERAAREQTEREQREIDAATLLEAADEAHALLRSLAPKHITTRKLSAALKREQLTTA